MEEHDDLSQYEWTSVSQDRIEAMARAMMLTPFQGIIPTLSVSYIRRRILGIEDNEPKPKFKYGK